MTTNAELKRLAEQATQYSGRWKRRNGANTHYFDSTVMASVFTAVCFANRDDADYITAANPARIIALVDEVERLRGALNGIVDGDADYLTDAQNIARQALAGGQVDE
jgi:hypothetical protein